MSDSFRQREDSTAQELVKGSEVKGFVDQAHTPNVPVKKVNNDLIRIDES